MESYDIVITKLSNITEDIIYEGKPYISRIPRPCYSIVYIFEGKLIYITDKFTYTVEPETVFIIPEGEIDISKAKGKYVKYLYMDFNISEPVKLSDTSLARINILANPCVYEQLFRKAVNIWNSRVFGYAAQCREVLYTIINRIINENHVKTEMYYKYNKIKAAIQKIEMDFANDITLQELADICSMSKSNLSRIFVEVTGMTPIRYLCEKRINNAKRLLESKAVNIGEIALMCGYSDIYSFSRAFSRICGYSPSKYY